MRFVYSGVKEALQAYGRVFNIVFKPEVDVMSGKAKRILSDPENRRRYLSAIEPLIKEEKKEVDVKLTDEEFTMTVD